MHEFHSNVSDQLVMVVVGFLALQSLQEVLIEPTYRFNVVKEFSELIFVEDLHLPEGGHH